MSAALRFDVAFTSVLSRAEETCRMILEELGQPEIADIKKLTGGGADVAIEALGLQAKFEKALRCLRPGGTLSSLGVYSGKLQLRYDAFAKDEER